MKLLPRRISEHRSPAARRLRVFAAAVVVCLAGRAALAAPGTIESITVQGLVRMTNDAFRHALEIREGDAYDPVKLRAAFRRLWKLQLFSDIKIDAEDAPEGGKAIVIKIVERPALVSVSYEDNKVLTRTQIEDRLKEKKVSLDVGKPLDPKAIADAEAVIRDYLGEKGFLDATVGHEIQEVTQTSYGVNFQIRPGGKTRIEDIDFVGNTVLSDSRLKGALQLTQESHWYWPWSQKNLYHPVKWDQDVGAVRDLYQNLGYLDVEIRPPLVEVVEEKAARGYEPPPAAEPGSSPAPETSGPSAPEEATSPTEEAPATPSSEKAAKKAEKKRLKEEEKARKRAAKENQQADPKVKRWVHLTVPIVEGPQYRAGKITITGNTVLREDEIRNLIPVIEGSVLSAGLVKVGIDNITKAYGNRGYLYANAVRQIQRRPEERIADVQISITEDKPYYLSRIEFSGNTVTQDRVLRREMRLQEGDLFNRSLLDLSKAKINQLGYFEVQGEPQIEPIEGESQVRVRINGEEKGRNEIQVGGGYSGVDGAFFTGYYSTKNFLGMGEVVSVSAQVGGRSTYYTVQFLEPWFMNRPYSLGFNVFRSAVDYGGSLQTSSRGFGVRLGRLFGPFTYGQVRFDWQRVESTGYTVGAADSTNKISSMTPSVSYNRINNPYRPNRGYSVDVSAQIAGGFLGGDTSFLRPIVQGSYYKPTGRKMFAGVHTEIGLVQPFLERTTTNSATINGVPSSQRFWLGGDTLGPRVFDIRTVTPRRFVEVDSTGQIVDTTRDPTGDPVSKWDRNGDQVLNFADLVDVGGDRFYLLQGEYVFGFTPTVEAALFCDVGNTLFEDQSWGFDDVRISAGIELRFYLPVFPVPLRLIYGKAIRSVPGDGLSGFMFSIGRSF